MTEFDFDAPIERRAAADCRKWNRYPADTLPMWVADMDFAVPEPIQAALRKRLAHAVFGYAGPPASLIEAILKMLEVRHGWKVAPEAIVMLPGVEPGFNMALRGLLSPGDGVVVQTPIYAPIRAAPLHWGQRRIDAPLKHSSSGFSADLPALESIFAEEGTKAFLLCNPHNPTGKVYDADELSVIAASCLRHNVLIISDEIHGDLVYEGRRHYPIASLAPEIADSSITLMSASKTYNIAGLKAAFAIIPNTALRQAFIAARAGMVDSVNLMGLVATEAALREGEAWRRALLVYLQGNRDFLVREIAQRFPMIGFQPPQASFLAWLDCRSLALAAEPAQFLLEKACIAVSGGEEFGALGAGHIRLNFGCRRATLIAALKRLEQALNDPKGTLRPI
jgi:cystathionine beta-lyase